MITIKTEFSVEYDYKQYQTTLKRKKITVEREIIVRFSSASALRFYERNFHKTIILKNDSGDTLVLTHANAQGKLVEYFEEVYCDLVCCYPKRVKENYPEFQERRINIICENKDAEIYCTIWYDTHEMWVGFAI